MHPLAAAPWALAGALAEASARVPWPSQGKLARTFALRRDIRRHFATFGLTGRDPSRPLLWFHAPSVGEGLQVRPVLERLRARQPDWQVAYTFFSPSAERFAAGLGVDFAAPLPFDTARGASLALDALQPSALVFGKLDVWPVLVEAANARRIPVGMISATLAADSGRTSWWARALLSESYAVLTAVGAIADADAERLTRVGVPASVIRVTGDTRYDQVWARASAPPTDRAARALVASKDGTRPTLVAGSTWPADDAVLVDAWRQLRTTMPTVRLVVAPHELRGDPFAPWRALATDLALRTCRLDEDDAATADIVLVDRVGVLGDLYAAAHVAFVGGGFHSAGLHSVLEPAAFGVPVLCGPRDPKQRDAIELAKVGGLVRVSGVAELVAQCRRWFESPNHQAAAGDAARRTVQHGLEAADRSLDLVCELVQAGERDRMN